MPARKVQDPVIAVIAWSLLFLPLPWVSITYVVALRGPW